MELGVTRVLVLPCVRWSLRAQRFVATRLVENSYGALQRRKHAISARGGGRARYAGGNQGGARLLSTSLCCNDASCTYKSVVSGAGTSA